MALCFCCLLGKAFRIRWESALSLPFSKTESIRNPLNENKPVKVCRDGQELPENVGDELIQAFKDFQRNRFVHLLHYLLNKYFKLFILCIMN